MSDKVDVEMERIMFELNHIDTRRPVTKDLVTDSLDALKKYMTKFEVHVCNLDKSITSKALLQIAQHHSNVTSVDKAQVFKCKHGGNSVGVLRVIGEDAKVKLLTGMNGIAICGSKITLKLK